MPRLPDGQIVDVITNRTGPLSAYCCLTPRVLGQAVSPTVVRTLSRKAFRHLVVDAEVAAAETRQFVRALLVPRVEKA